MKKTIFTCSLALIISVSNLSVFADSENINSNSENLTNYNQSITKPDSFSKNGKLDNGKSIHEEEVDLSESESKVSPRIFMGYSYINNTATRGSRSIIYKHKYIYGTSVSYVKGASPNYTLTVTKQTSQSKNFSASGSVDFPVKVVEAQVSGGYSSSATATVSKGQTWSCNFTTPGLYDLSWYMRAHRYPVYGKAKILSTGSDHGTITSVTLGTITFPVDEIHFDVTKK